jgi:hypothetical protein
MYSSRIALVASLLPITAAAAACTNIPAATIANGTWPAECANALSGTQCVASCVAGYTGTAYTTCGAGSWSDVTGQCSPQGEQLKSGSGDSNWGWLFL